MDVHCDTHAGTHHMTKVTTEDAVDNGSLVGYRQHVLGSDLAAGDNDLLLSELILLNDAAVYPGVHCQVEVAEHQRVVLQAASNTA